MRTLLIDNHDSFTFNLFQLIAETYGTTPCVLPNDHPDLSAALADGFDAVVVSPGPGRPSVSRDIGRSLDVMQRSATPVLGVCLGHQALGLLAGASIQLAAEPRHGHLTTVRHRGAGLFADLPPDFTAVRYHSLCLAEPLPAALIADAWSEDEVVMAVHHRSRPWWGVQFHPESVASEGGAPLLANFRALVLGNRPTGVPSRPPFPVRAPLPGPAPSAAPQPAQETAQEPGRAAGQEAGQAAGQAAAPTPAPAVETTAWSLRTRVLPHAVDAGTAFQQLCAGRPYAFWLDSCHPCGELSRFSFVGHPDGPGGEVLTYDTADQVVTVLDGRGRAPDTVTGSVTDLLQQRLAERHVAPDPELPFDLTGGYVGYLGYEIKADCGSPNAHASTTPDAVWVFASRFVAVDHAGDQTWVVAATRPDADDVASAERWLDHAADVLQPAGVGAPTTSSGSEPLQSPPPDSAVALDPVHLLGCQPQRYVDSIGDAQAQLRAGESYEVCLTNEAVVPFRGDALAVYRRQRGRNPAPYSAFLRLGPVEVMCSSPERFVRIDRSGVIESRPMKGTAPRGATAAADSSLSDQLASSAKTRAENLMIVDLLRNDLGRVCEIGSVHVPSFMAVESYATVHQLVSTVRGRLRPGVDAVTAVCACFPGGSMTGAPKQRTTEIIERLEGRARGVYSGALGYVGLSGAADLNIVIRTAVVVDETLRVGAGGAIVLASDPEDEYEEMLLKMRAALCGVRDEDVGPSITA
ncbi:hypothetical protein BH20ACT6_BH20ACT6_16810 [soil metagenome]